MMTLLLIRHGQSETNLEEIFSGQIDPALTDLGLKQAELTSKYVADNYKVDKIYSSDLQRAFNTAKPLAKILGKDIIKEENLREIDAGKWEGVKFSELKEKYKEEFGTWLNDMGKAKCTGGESIKEMGQRIYSALTEIAEENDGKTVAVTIHSTPIRAFESFIETGGFDEMQNIPWVSNASVSVFSYSDKAWKVVSISEDAHLGSLKSELPTNV